MEQRYLPLIEAVEAATGVRISVPTVYRWITKPRNGVLLQTVRIGGRRFTTVPWVNAYIEATNKQPSVAVVPPRQAERSADRAAKQLRRRLSKKSSR